MTPEGARNVETTTPLTILLMGGIASGKSTVAALFEKRGAVVLDADRIAHAELATPDAIAQVTKIWGDSVLGADGKVERKKLGMLVFGKPDEIKKLEAILHPRVRAAMSRRVSELAGRPRRVVILDAPVGAEAGIKADLTVFVDASLETRLKRARELRGWSEGELERRESSQLSVAEKRRMADAVVTNDQGVPEAERDVERIWTSLVGPRLEG
ncbi:MAG: dephospho-CoA kinase [Planctomycetota bacterium]